MERRIKDEALHLAEEAKAARRLNVGAGQYPLLYWMNLDEAPDAIADIYAHVPPLPFHDAALDDIYAGHFLEHLPPTEADAFLGECFRCLAPGGRLGVLVPDTRAILTHYVQRRPLPVECPEGVFHSMDDLDHVCRLFLYSTIQDSRHQWSYDSDTLKRRLEAAGFTVTAEIDRMTDPRIPVGAWYQCGWDAVRP